MALMVSKPLIYSILALVLFAVSVQAAEPADECGSCVERKQRMCADECEEVPQARARSCQQKCIAGYCSHRCAADAPELQAYSKENCDDCLEQQFDLCDPHCPVGTERRRSVCKLKCSNERCADLCQKDTNEKSPN